MTEDAGRVPLVAGNWKMFKTRSEARSFCAELAAGLGELGDGVDIAICPPATSLDIVVAALTPLGLDVYAQNGYGELEGAFTGEVSMRQLADAGATGVLLGHSERRALFGETDEALAAKVPAAVAAGLTAVLCVGETDDEREAGRERSVVEAQLRTGLRELSRATPDALVVAYEPVWAIGTGKTATPEIAQEMHAHIRSVLDDLFGSEAAASLSVLYGGSVKPANAGELLGQPDVDGGLVGGASLEAASLLEIARAAVA
jgi:triosephosphate isomerase (TIM)